MKGNERESHETHTVELRTHPKGMMSSGSQLLFFLHLSLLTEVENPYCLIVSIQWDRLSLVLHADLTQETVTP